MKRFHSSPHQHLKANLPARAAAVATVLLAAIGTAAMLSPQPVQAKMMHMPKGMITSRPAELQKCVGCHGPGLDGRKGFSPSLHRSGVLKEYNKKTFERVMDTGMTNDNHKVKPPMPVYNYPAKVSDRIYSYLMTLK